MSYQRVIPRDLFNEAKLLKCLGRLSLFILDNKDCCSEYISDFLVYESEDFKIEQSNLDGSIFSNNYRILLKRNNDYIDLSHPLNCKLNFPLCFNYNDESDFVFDDDGNLSEEFLALIKGGSNE